MDSLMNRLLKNGAKPEEMDHHGSDLYVPVTPATTAVIDAWFRANGFQKDLFVNEFTDNVTGGKMYDVAFQYDPFWNKAEKKNTKVHYIYRDGANYKLHFSVILSGEIPEDVWEKLKDAVYLDEFYPAKLGLPADTFVTQGYAEYPDDPDNHEIMYWELTDKEPTVNCTAEDFVKGLLNGVCTLKKEDSDGDQ